MSKSSILPLCPSAAAAVLLLRCGALLALSSSTAHADPDEPSLEELNERIAALEEYDAELVQYTSAKEEVERATEELEEIEEKLEAARDDVALIAASQYKSSGFDPVIEVMVSRSPDEVLSDVALITQVSHINGERVSHLSELRRRRSRPRRRPKRNWQKPKSSLRA